MWEMRGAGTQSFVGSGRSWARSARSGSRRTAGGHFSGAAFGRLPVYQNQFGWGEDRPDVAGKTARVTSAAGQGRVSEAASPRSGRAGQQSARAAPGRAGGALQQAPRPWHREEGLGGRAGPGGQQPAQQDSAADGPWSRIQALSLSRRV